MKKIISFVVIGLLAMSMTVFAAVEMNIVPNPFPVKVNGVVTDVEGYNIDGSTFLKLSDFVKTGLDVNFNEANKEIEIGREKLKPEFIVPDQDNDEYGGADVYDNGGDNSNSRYYVNPDFYRMTSDDQLTILEQFKTFNQTTEWSCGSASILMVANHFGFTDVSEWDIAVESGAHRDLDVKDSEPGTANNPGEYGTSVDDIIRYFEDFDGLEVIESSYQADYTDADLIASDDNDYAETDRGNLPPSFSAMSLYTTDNDDASENWVEDAADSYFVKWIKGHLEANRPIMVEWGDWDGHWQVIIGYDTNGTAGLGDDMLIFADPYDTSDHWQDGYYYYPLERWFYMWQDRNVAPKPYQLQPYVVVDVE